MDIKITLLIVTSIVTNSQSISYESCHKQLGMEHYHIKDEDIKTSSMHHNLTSGVQARIRTEIGGGAWCPKAPTANDYNDDREDDWLEIDLKSLYLITSTETQGRFANGQGKEFAEKYRLEYYRPSVAKWKRYKPRIGDEWLKGNENEYLEFRNYLNPPIVAQKIRFYPTLVGRTVCMRVELWGCQWNEGIVSYSIPQGDTEVRSRRGKIFEFYDTTYDVPWDGYRLKSGLGMLTDGQLAADHFRNTENINQTWIGWNNESREFVDLIFEFDGVREFSSVSIHCNNEIRENVRVFSEAKVFFSYTSQSYRSPQPISYTSFNDTQSETARTVFIPLHRRIGKFVKLQLYFADQWMLISEVTFDSVLAAEQYEIVVSTEVTESDLTVSKTTVANDDFKLSSPKNIFIILGGIIGIILIGIVVSVIVWKCRARTQGTQKNDLIHSPSLGYSTTTSDSTEAEYAEPLTRGHNQVPQRGRNYHEEVGPSFHAPPPPTSTPPPLRNHRPQYPYISPGRPIN